MIDELWDGALVGIEQFSEEGCSNERPATLTGVWGAFVFSPALNSVQTALSLRLLKIEPHLSKSGGFLRLHSGPQIGFL